MRSYGRGSVFDFLGDMVVYRNLVPSDRRLPSLGEARPHVGVAEGITPRKSEPAYGRVIAYILQKARAVEIPGVPLTRLVYVGDTQLNDGTAFANVCQAGQMSGMAFIGSDRAAPPKTEIAENRAGTLFVANRWAAIAKFQCFLEEEGFAVDERTAVIIDLDKTALGARGRNDQVINEARVAAVRQTVEQALGGEFDADRFQTAYDELNHAEYHAFTRDNQDYLAYICLILGSGLVDLGAVVDDVIAGRLTSFEQFLLGVDAQADKLGEGLRPIHKGIAELVRAGDPTPFKAFRYNEYETTVGRMGFLDDGAPPADMLAHEIVITEEVRAAACGWREQGALMFGLSDKPDEASVPSDAMAARGYVAIHHKDTHVVGEE